MAQVNIKDLEPLLHSTLGDNIVLLNFTVKDLLPPGENFGSHIVDIHAIIKKNKKSDSEDLFLVGKLPTKSAAQLELCDRSLTFRKEIFMYAKILPFYRQLEIDNGVKKHEAFDICPKLYGARMSLNPEYEFADDDAVILLENLKPKGYYCVNRKIGSDLIHAKHAVRALARFHALGMATKEKNREFFDIIKSNATSFELRNPEIIIAVIKQRVEDIAADPDIREHLDNCIAMVGQDAIAKWLAPPVEPWSSFTHSDFWVNNIMYHRKDDDGEPDDIKFIDYPHFLFLNPIREMIFYVTTGLDCNAINHIDELIDLYYNTIIERLKILNCNVAAYSRESFDANIREAARIEFPRGLTQVKIMTLDADSSDSDCQNVMHLLAFGKTNDRYKRKLKDFVKTYSRKGWL